MIFCRNIAGERYTLKDSFVLCNGDYYNSFVLPYNLSVFLLMGIVIPIFLFFVLKRKFKNKEL